MFPLCCSALFLCVFFAQRSAGAPNDFRRIRILDEEPADSQRELMDRCQAILSSTSAQFFEQRVFPFGADVEEAVMAEEAEGADGVAVDFAEPRLMDGRNGGVRYNIVPRDHLDRISRALKSSAYASKLCNPETLFPFVPEVGDSAMSCSEICSSCVAGSLAVCHERNKRFPGIAQSCFCTYDAVSPLHNAVLVLKAQKRFASPSALLFDE